MAMLLSACGTGDGGTDQGQHDGDLTTGNGGEKENESLLETEDDQENSDEAIDTAAADLVPEIQEDGTLVFQYHVSNPTEEEITLAFSSSQKYDYSVETKAGEEVFLFSSAAMFLQAQEEEVLSQGEELVFDIDLNELHLSDGEYVLKVWLTPAEGSMLTETTEFSVE